MSTLKGVGRDYVRASEIQMHGVEMLVKAWAVHLAIYAIPALVIATLVMFVLLSRQDWLVFAGWCRAHLESIIPVGLPAFFGGISPEVLLANSTIRGTAWHVILIGLGVYGSALTAAGFLTWARIKKTHTKGEELSQDDFIRGQKLAPVEDVKKQVEAAGASKFALGEVPLVAGSERSHIMIVGAPGTGKSVTISALLRQIEAQGDSAIIYDLAGDYVRHFYDPDRGDAILNPADKRCAKWLPWADIKSEFDCRSLAESLIPEPAGNADRYWTDAARAVVGSSLSLRNSLPEWLNLLLASDLEGFAEEFAGTDAAAMVSAENEKTTMSIRATISTYLKPFRLLRQPTDDLFSIRGFVNSAAAGGNSRMLFITSRADLHSAIKPLISAWLDIAARSILSLPPDHSRRIWLILDELPSLHKLPTLSDALAQGRKHGLCGVLGLQSIAQLRDLYKKDGAEALGGLCNTWQIFRSPEPETARWCANALGKHDLDEVHESLSYGVDDARDGVRWERRRQERDVVMPTEIMALPSLYSYVRLPGEFPICRTKSEIVQMPDVAEAFEAVAVSQMDRRKPAASQNDDASTDEQTVMIGDLLDDDDLNLADIISDVMDDDAPEIVELVTGEEGGEAA